MGFFANDFLAKRRKQWMDSIVKFQYQVSGTWYDAVINKREVSGTKVMFTVHIPNVPASGHTIRGLRIIDIEGTVAGSQEISLERTATQGVLATFEFPIQEV
ncbi:MAG: hypothetical protein E7607_00750 [Ruminococcaceae bacterium]|nr:hypothetical protein [Oscillospiraceae bacterium]